MDERDLPLISVGIPTYNRADGLRRTLECITNQSYKNIEIVISDNCSTDGETGKICREYAEKDRRIHYFVQKENQGPVPNFGFVLEHASGEYFMWAADDDEWEPTFIENCLKMHLKSGNCSLSFTNIVNINDNGEVARNYPSFKRFVFKSLFLSSCRFVLSHEYNGKANLFYGLYKRPVLLTNFKSMQGFTCWGADMVFVLKNILDSGLCIDERILFKKGIDSSFKSQKKCSMKDIIQKYAIPPDYYRCFVKNIYPCKYSYILILLMTLKFLFSNVLTLAKKIF